MITVVLVRPQNPSNIGFIARSMKNFDLEKLILIEPQCDYLSENAYKTSKHAKVILKNAVEKKYDYLTKLKNDFNLVVGTSSVVATDYNIPRTSLMPAEFAEKIKNEDVAIVFGNEGTGLSNKEIGNCDFLITIPSSKNYPALNISHAAIIIFYEIYQSIGKNKVGDFEPASPKDKEIIMQKLNNILDNLEFTTKEKKQTQKIVWKRIFEKSMMSKREAFAILGLLQKINKCQTQ